MYFQAETAEATIDNNICFNIPRAAVNFNDGFGGGAEMKNNLLFNTCRESSDRKSLAMLILLRVLQVLVLLLLLLRTGFRFVRVDIFLSFCFSPFA